MEISIKGKAGCFFITTFAFAKVKIQADMNLKLILLLAIGLLVLGAIAWQLVRAWRYRRNHPDETYWPYNDPKEDNEK